MILSGECWEPKVLPFAEKLACCVALLITALDIFYWQKRQGWQFIIYLWLKVWSEKRIVVNTTGQTGEGRWRLVAKCALHSTVHNDGVPVFVSWEQTTENKVCALDKDTWFHKVDGQLYWSEGFATVCRVDKLFDGNLGLPRRHKLRVVCWASDNLFGVPANNYVCALARGNSSSRRLGCDIFWVGRFYLKK